MSDTVESANDTTEAPAPTPEAPKAPESHDLPDWARKQISAANQEAANYRVQLREAEKARKSLEDQVTALASDKEAASSTASTVQADFDKLVTAIQAEVPLQKVFTFANTLKGDTPEQLAAHAAELKEMFGLPIAPSPAVDRSQGLGGDKVNTDPASEFVSFLQSSLKR